MVESSEEPRTPNKTIIDDGPDEGIYYSNIALITINPEELFFHFGLRDKDTPNRGTGVTKVFLSLPHAKRLVRSLSNLITEHERVFGEIVTEMDKHLTPEGRKKFGLEDSEPEGDNVSA